jgi:hypothetical protein
MNRNRTNPRIARFAVPLALVAVGALLAAGCAARTTNRGPVGPAQRTTPLTLADRGKLVPLHVGDQIRVSLGDPGSGGAWTVASYPRPLLTITSSDPGHGLFTFQARSKGQGLVGFSLRGKCGPPLLEAMPDGTLCPDAAGGKASKELEPGFPVPVTLITYTVRVS